MAPYDKISGPMYLLPIWSLCDPVQCGYWGPIGILKLWQQGILHHSSVVLHLLTNIGKEAKACRQSPKLHFPAFAGSRHFLVAGLLLQETACLQMNQVLADACLLPKGLAAGLWRVQVPSNTVFNGPLAEKLSFETWVAESGEDRDSGCRRKVEYSRWGLLPVRLCNIKPMDPAQPGRHLGPALASICNLHNMQLTGPCLGMHLDPP